MQWGCISDTAFQQKRVVVRGLEGWSLTLLVVVFVLTLCLFWVFCFACVFFPPRNTSGSQGAVQEHRLMHKGDQHHYFSKCKTRLDRSGSNHTAPKGDTFNCNKQTSRRDLQRKSNHILRDLQWVAKAWKILFQQTVCMCVSTMVGVPDLNLLF